MHNNIKSGIYKLNRDGVEHLSILFTFWVHVGIFCISASPLKKLYAKNFDHSSLDYFQPNFKLWLLIDAKLETKLSKGETETVKKADNEEESKIDKIKNWNKENKESNTEMMCK